MEIIVSKSGKKANGEGDVIRNNNNSIIQDRTIFPGKNRDEPSSSTDNCSNVRKVELQRSITLFGVISILIANIGGTGIFIAPTTILAFAGSPGLAMIMWTLGGFVQICLAFCVVELAQLFNKAGGPYYFINHTFGDLASFVFMWGYLIFLAAPSWALGAYTASLYSLSLIFTDCPPPEGLVRLIAAWIMVTLIAMNCTYMKIITNIQKFLTSCKVIALILIIILGFINIPTESGQENIRHFMDETTTDIGKMSLALFASYFAFGGWYMFPKLPMPACISLLAEHSAPQGHLQAYHYNFVGRSEEAKKPCQVEKLACTYNFMSYVGGINATRSIKTILIQSQIQWAYSGIQWNIPYGLGFSLAVLIGTMVATNFAYYTVLTKEESLKSDAVAMLFGQMIHPTLPVIIAILVCLCSIGTLNVLILGHPRMIFAAGRKGHMPKIMTMLHKEFHSPWPATITLGMLSIIMLMSGSVVSLVETISLYAAFMMLMLLMCLFTLRWKKSNVPHPFKVPMVVPVFMFILTGTLVMLSVVEMPRELGLVALVISLGVPVYYVCVKLQKPEKLFDCMDKLGMFLQVCLHLRYEDK